MEKKGKRILKDTFKGTEVSSLDVCNVISTGSLWGNEALRAKYNEMHKQGSTSWFSDGREERETILKMGEPWKGLSVLEIGCGEGELSFNVAMRGALLAVGYDYSEEAIRKTLKHPKLDNLNFIKGVNYKNWDHYPEKFHRLVMQGVLEHLDDPFAELQWMIEHFKPKTVITSSPCFLNPRGIVWMTLDMLGAVMSKTDLHYLNPWQFQEFCKAHGYNLTTWFCDWSWGNSGAMIEDLRNRIPLALKDGKLPVNQEKIDHFLAWLDHVHLCGIPATAVYRIDIC